MEVTTYVASVVSEKTVNKYSMTFGIFDEAIVTRAELLTQYSSWTCKSKLLRDRWKRFGSASDIYAVALDRVCLAFRTSHQLEAFIAK